MTKDPRTPETSSRDLDAPSRSAPARSVTVTLIQDLKQLRNLVLERLSSIEALAREQSAAVLPERNLSALEESFKRKSAELDETRHLLEAQSQRQKQDWIASMAQLEDDRRLLAEAWERIDQQRIDALSAPHENPGQHPPRHHPQAAISTGQPAVGAAAPVRSAGADSDTYDPVAQAILQQFQTLCNDVRQSAHGRRASR